MYKSSRRLIAAGIVAGILALGTPAIAASAAPVDGVTHITTVGETIVSSKSPITTKAQLAAFEQSATPKVITIDPATNTVVSVTETTAAQARGVSSPCTTGVICWSAAKTPYADFGFSVVGTYTGPWSWRNVLRSNNWGGQATYTINGSGASSMTPVFGHNSVIDFTNPTVNNVTGTKMVVKA